MSMEREKMKDECYQVVIIGAGISGLSAARQLRKNGIDNFIILEAMDKAGGRIDTVPFGNGLVELGAQWIHGEQNEFCQLVKASNHRHEKTSWEGKGDFLCPTGIKIENGMVDEVLGWVEDTIEEVEATFSIDTLETGKEVNGTNGDSSMGEYLLRNFESHLNTSLKDEEEEHNLQMALFQWGMSFQRIDNSCNRMNDVSLYRWSEFEVNPGEHYNNFREGAQSFIDDILVGELKDMIKYNHSVKNIQWETNDPNAPVKITTRNGATFLAQSVIITCSIGVLKSSMESLFTPTLPEKHALVIKSTGYGPVTKIFLEWDKPWWPSDLKGFQLVWPNEYIDCCGSQKSDNLEESWHKTITGFDPVLDNPNVLVGWLGGPEAVYAETIPKDKMMSRCIQVLKEFTGYDVPEPKNILVSQWNSNEFFQGAYSFRSVDGDKIPGDICAALCEPISVADKPVILFAGEALSKNHYSTLHGAYESGISQAQKLIQYFSSSTQSQNILCNPVKTFKDNCNEDANAKPKNFMNSQSSSLSGKLKNDKILSEEMFQKIQNISVKDIEVPS